MEVLKRSSWHSGDLRVFEDTLICWSDCGSNFKVAQGYMSEVTKDWNVQEMEEQLANNSCQFEWKWNIPHASHMNGVVESLIKSVRHAINATCKNQAFTEEQWRDLFIRSIIYIVNSRPLYPSSDEICESPPMTANDILPGQHHEPLQPLPEEKVNPRNLMRSTQKRIEDFWNCWMKYFAPNLLPRNKWNLKKMDEEKFSEDLMPSHMPTCELRINSHIQRNQDEAPC
ncbi:hypothetical protein AC249_AIPGENE2878 [Exaiptasia diaphana]|nr:hypothetical protein AC249_AIPGENE2878 [Exaiptasia diaphana]